ncbi:MAG: hypothetical protein DHS20C15_23750 [Planctomycetota bacterium]|nr:MAG: hypothetical protein DHS20C15_23750 [Planctomycetota bacterium]
MCGALLCGACTVIERQAGRDLPSAESVASLLARSASRAEVLRAFGPSDEYRAPRPMQARRLEPLAPRVADDGRLLLPDTLSYTQERSRDRRFVFLPFLNFFSWRHEHAELDRLELRFDEAGRLTGAARRVGGGA